MNIIKKEDTSLRLRKIHHLVNRYFSSLHIQKDDKNINKSFSHVLFYLVKNENKKICQKDIEEHLKLTKGTVSLLLKSLEDEDMIEKQQDYDDKRFKYIKITKKAQDLKKELLKHNKKLNEQMTKTLTDEEKIQLNHLLDKLIINMEDYENEYSENVK